ncbi:hypothetical protein [Shimia aestuarii]|uniref:Cytochrome C n=1 Tax=Shimia aestuarii TaxID=254406 RepID=A0A1I4HNQ2_9RHOB|nr:hypothetical protein [Shimia aestuarii]SFL43805.1 hypothetical protein SAMN04488042_101196 [Shimia aestuarii]
MSLACKAGWGVSAVLAGVIVIGGYKLIVQGHTVPSEDGRTVVLLSEDERNRVLAEMRGLLEAAKGITQAAVVGDMETVAAEARAVGMAAADGESPALMAKLPLDFLQLGMSAHKAMDDLADLALTTDDPLVVLGAMGEAMEACTGCHAGYRLGVEGIDGDL